MCALYLGYLLGAKNLEADNNNAPEKTHHQHSNNTNNNQPSTHEIERQAHTAKGVLSTSSTHNTRNSTFELFTAALIASNYDKAMRLYHDALQIDSNAKTLFKKQFIQHISLLSEQSHQDSARIESALNTYLADFYDDIDILLLLVQQHTENHQFYDALSTLQLANSYAYDNKYKQQTIQSYRNFIKYTLNTYIPQNNWQALLDVYATAESMDLLLEEDTFNLIKIHAQEGNKDQAIRYADLLLQNPVWTEKVNKLLETLQLKIEPDTELASASSEIAIPLTKINDQFVIAVDIDRASVSLLIDTGASITTIGKSTYDVIAPRLNSRFIKKAVFSTANGKTTGELYQIGEFKIGQYIINDATIAVLDFPASQHHSGLLGMNILSKFRFEIEQKNSTLILKDN